MRQLEKLLKIPVGQLRPELVNLEKAKLLTSTKHGNQKRYSVNKEHPLHDDLRNIFLKTTGAGDALRECLSTVSGIELAFIYGSFAKGEEHSASDMDIMIVGESSDAKVSRALSKAEKSIGRAINHSLYDRKEVKERLRKKDSFITSVFNEPYITILGTNNDELFRPS